jgi:hypothetical protein
LVHAFDDEVSVEHSLPLHRWSTPAKMTDEQMKKLSSESKKTKTADGK